MIRAFSWKVYGLRLLPPVAVGEQTRVQFRLSSGVSRMNRAKSAYSLALLLLVCAFLTWAAAPNPSDTAGDSWPYYGHDAGGMRYSPLTQINRDNVSTLKV